MTIPLGTPGWQWHMHRYARELLERRTAADIRGIVEKHKEICGDRAGDNLSAFLNYQLSEIRENRPLQPMPESEARRMREFYDRQPWVVEDKVSKLERDKARFVESRKHTEALAS